MLMQNFQTAEALGITDAEREALRTVLGMLERGELPQRTDWPLKGLMFDMGDFLVEDECGTAACIVGHAHLASGRRVFEDWVAGGVPYSHVDSALHELFLPDGVYHLYEITPEQAAVAVRSFLTTGAAKWAEALAA